ncbi:glycosyltransferase family 1 protein [Mitsuokella multacida]|uniref:glycosyltransferase family 1 protein n=1 Tax=Mitsuokella multacida TaxID=52226 RepID=UPI003D03EBF5
MRVLQATIANDKGGLTGYIVDNYRHIDRNEFQFDFITYDNHLDFQDEIRALGAKIYRFPHPTSFFKYYYQLKKIRRENSCDIIHFHMSYANVIPLIAAKLAGFPRIIMHSHSTGLDTASNGFRIIKLLIHKIGRQVLPLLATDFLACSKLAANWMYPTRIIKKHQYKVMHNAIELDKFKFNNKVRNDVRKQLGISDDCYVVGHVGRFTYPKNHEFLVDIFFDIHKRNPNVMLLLIGDGPDRLAIEKKVKKYGLANAVRFLGQRSDIPSLYQAIDVMVLPSRFEGLCIVAIEAQAAGIPCICSEALPQEAKVTCNFTYKSLADSAENWSKCVLAQSEKERIDTTAIIRSAGYDADFEIKRIECLYRDSWSN